MSSAKPSAAPASAPPASQSALPRSQVQPLVPFSIIDAPSQRFYAVALAVLVQAWKYARVLTSLLFAPSQPAGQGTASFSLSNAVLINFATLFVLSRLGIPLLDPRLAASLSSPPATDDPKRAVLQPSKTKGLTYFSYVAIFCSLSIFDAILLGDGAANPAIVVFNMLLVLVRSLSSLLGINFPLAGIATDVLSRQLSISEGRVRIRDLVQPRSHILGQHTIHILPHSTAKLSPASACYCVGPSSPRVSIPVLFSNTEPDLLQYSITDFVTGESGYFNVSVDSLVPFTASKPNHEADELSAVAAASSGSRGRSTNQPISSEDDLDEPGSLLQGSSYGERARLRAERRARSFGTRSSGSKGTSSSRGQAARPGQQLLWHLPVSQPGRVRLERVLDKSRMDARLSRSEALVVHCPSTTFIPPQSSPEQADLTQVQHRCLGEKADFLVRVDGIPPLQLEYRQVWDALRSDSSARSRAGSHEVHPRKISRIAPPHHTSPLLLPEADALLSPAEKMALARERTRSAARRSGLEVEDYSWAASVAVDLPLSGIDLNRPGNFTYILDGVVDACGNRVEFGGSATSSGLSLAQKARKKITGSRHDSAVHQQSVAVHPRRSVSFDAAQCRPGFPLPLLRNTRGLEFNLRSPEEVEEQGDWKIDVSFEPDNSAASKGLWAHPPAEASRSLISLASSARQATITAVSPGLYRIEDVSGPYCSGEVGAPWICEVVDVPPPTAQIKFSSIEDRCAGPVGVKAMSVLTGKPPFALEYEVQKQGRSPERKIRYVHDQTRDELDFRPDIEGAVTYKFIKLHDSNYRDIVLDGPSFTQVFHPLSSAEFMAQVRQHDDRAVIQSCSGKQAQADVKLSGAGPWDLTYAIRSGDTTETKEVKNISESPYKLSIDIPESTSKSGGIVTVSLIKIRDAKGCERSLATRDLNVEVRRVQPNIGFLPIKLDKEGRRSIELLSGKQARLPIRLSGQGPWQVEYSYRENETSEEQHRVASLRDVNAELLAEHPGIYTIKGVNDNYCPGLILQGQEEYRVTVRARPHVQFALDAGAAARNGSLIRPAICQGKPDSVDVLMSGSFPIDVEYEHVAPSWSTNHELDGSGALASAANELSSHGKRRRVAFTSALNTTNLELSTVTPGWHTYLLSSVGDAAYPLTPLSGFSVTEPRRLEQMILPLPSGSFASSHTRHHRPSLCVGDALSKLSNPPTYRMQGKAPFSVTFEIRGGVDTSASQSMVHQFTRSGINTHEYKLELSGEEFSFNSKGIWTIRALDISDANGCESSLISSEGNGDSRNDAFEVEVAETADITALSTREDYCIGEMVEFSLQGSPPWTITYDFNGKSAHAAVSTPEFSRVAEKPGVLTIKSIAHQQNQCKRDINPRISQDMVKTIHDLPTVRISEGNHYIEDLREGNQAEIIFNFKGVPPFSFTYQRTEPIDTHTRPKVLETNTVSGILETKYSIWAAVEGTWSVTWLQDRWCQVSLDYHSGAATPLGKSRLAIKNSPENAE